MEMETRAPITDTVALEEEIVIRAAAFSRLVRTVCGFAREYVFQHEELKYMTAQIFDYATFTTDDMDLLAQMILEIVRLYCANPSVNSKMNMCMAIQLTGTKIMDVGNAFAERNKRAMEMTKLNNAFYDLSKKIEDKDVRVKVERTILQDHGFRPESEFVTFRCSSA